MGFSCVVLFHPVQISWVVVSTMAPRVGVVLLGLLALSVVAADELGDDEAFEWRDTEITTMLWRIISSHDDISALEALIQQDPRVVKVRSADGRGPLFWAYEYGHTEAVSLLESLGADTEAKDKFGMTARELADADDWEDEDEEDEDEDDDEWEDE
eukprot:g57502.t1